MPRDLIRHWNTGNGSELVTSLPITTGQPYSFRVVFSQAVTDLRAGDILQILSEFEATNDEGYNCMIGCYVILATSAAATSGTEITEASGYNITPAMHHGMMTKVGTLIVPDSLAEGYVNVVAYAASTAAGTGDVLTVEQDYGRLSVLAFALGGIVEFACSIAAGAAVAVGLGRSRPFAAALSAQAEVSADVALAYYADLGYATWGSTPYGFGGWGR